MTGRSRRTGTAGRPGRKTAARAAAALAGCALLLTGCGIKRTGVIESGHPATVKSPGGNAAVLYYLSKEGDRLVPVPFPVQSGYTIAPGALVRLLLGGPIGTAQEAGLTTGLPRVSTSQAEIVSVSEYSPSAGITIRLPFAVGDLSPLARSQLVCTVGVSVVPDILSPVILQGSDTALPSAECDSKR
uniref:GerMN domain-containing protein n=1 Tax=Streptomyces sp. NBC_00049 TaxID=2903617 RepID=A0AAU2JXF2_9ACTN